MCAVFSAKAMVELLLIPAGGRDKIGCTAMHWAALNDRVDVITLLIRHKADLNLGTIPIL